MTNSTPHEFNLDYQALLNSMTDGLICLNDQYQIIMVNTSFETLTGLSAKELTGKNLLGLYPHVKQFPFFNNFHRVFETQHPHKIVEFFPKIQKWIEVSAYYQAGNMVVLLRDKTTNKQHEISLQAYADQINAVMNSMHTSFCLIDKDYKVLLFNKALSDNLLKYTNSQIKTGDNAIDWVHPKYRESYQADIDTALKGEKTFKEIMYNISDAQEPTWYYEAFYPVYNQQNEILGVAFHAQNINRLKQNEIKASYFNQLYANVLKATNEAIWEWNMKTNALKWNENFTRIFGYTNEKISYDSQGWEECIHPDDKAATLKKINDVLKSKGHISECTYRLLCKNGQYKYVIDRGYITYDEQGEPDMMVGAMQDIQLMKEHEEQILQQNKTLAQIAHSQSHEVRGPVSTILGLIDLLNKHGQELDEETRELIAHLYRTTVKLDNIIKDSIHKIEQIKE